MSSSTEQANHTHRLDEMTRTVETGRRDGAETKTVTRHAELSRRRRRALGCRDRRRAHLEVAHADHR